MRGLGSKIPRKSSKNDRENLENLENRGKKLFFWEVDFRVIFEIEKNKKKVVRGGRWDPAPESGHSTGKERSKGGTKYLRYLDSKQIHSTRLEARGLGGL